MKLSNGLTVREVRRLSDDGHQTAVITTNQRLSVFQVAYRMFSRWRQENFFRYMRHEFALDRLCTHEVEPADPQRLVAHPERKKLEQQIRTAQTSLGQLLGRRSLLKPGDTLRVKGRTLDEDEADALLRQREREIERLKARRDALPTKVPLDQTSRSRADRAAGARAQAAHRCLQDDRLSGRVVHGGLGGAVLCAARGRGPQVPTNHLPGHRRSAPRPEAQHPDGPLPRPLQPACYPRLADLCDIFTAEEVCYPGTDLRLHFEAPECHTN